MYPPLLGAALGSVCVGVVAATRVRGSAAGAGWPPCGANDSGALALAFADAGGFRGVAGVVVAVVFAAAGGFAGDGGGAEVTGVAASSGWSPWTEKVLIFRASLLGSVPLPPALASGEPVGATLAIDGGLPFWFSGGNTTRGPPAWPDLALTSTGASSRGTIFSVPSPADIRSGTLARPSAGAGPFLSGPARALMSGGPPRRGVPTWARWAKAAPAPTPASARTTTTVNIPPRRFGARSSAPSS